MILVSLGYDIWLNLMHNVAFLVVCFFVPLNVVGILCETLTEGIMNRKYGILEDREWLHGQYVEKKLTSTDIANIVGCTSCCVIKALKRNGIATRTAAQSRRIKDKRRSRSVKYGLLNDVEWLRKKYVDECLSTAEIARLAGAKTKGSVRQALIRSDIHVRNREEVLALLHREGRCVSRKRSGKVAEDNFIENVSVITGSLLGDAALTKPNRESGNTLPYFIKRNKNFEHVRYVAGLLWYKPDEQITLYVQNSATRKKCCGYCMRSLTHDFLIPWYKRWYPEWNEYEKVVPDDIVMNEIVLLHWFLDDGSTSFRTRNGKLTTQVRLCFNTQGFLKPNLDVLCELINDKFDLGARLAKDRLNKAGNATWRINIPQSQVDKFFEIIGPPPVWPLSYKWKGSQYVGKVPDRATCEFVSDCFSV